MGKFKDFAVGKTVANVEFHQGVVTLTFTDESTARFKAQLVGAEMGFSNKANVHVIFGPDPTADDGFRLNTGKEVQKVVCSHAKFPQCINCEHAVPHESKKMASNGQHCSTWEKCDGHGGRRVKVICVPASEQTITEHHTFPGTNQPLTFGPDNIPRNINAIFPEKKVYGCETGRIQSDKPNSEEVPRKTTEGPKCTTCTNNDGCLGRPNYPDCYRGNFR